MPVQHNAVNPHPSRPKLRAFIFVLTLLATLFEPGCGQNNTPKGGNYGKGASATLRRGLGGEPSSLDPGTASDTFSFEVLRDLYEGLAAEAADGTIIPGVAASWTVDKAGTRYEFHLRPDAKWSNGAPVQARDFVIAWQRVVDPSRASPLADTLRPVAGATAIIRGNMPPSSLAVFASRDDLLVVNLDRPTPYFPQILTHSATFPVYSADNAKPQDLNTRITNGAYTLTSWTPGLSLKLTKNLWYWDRRNVHIPNVEYVTNTDENAEYRQYRAGQLDLTQSVPSNAIKAIRSESPSELFVNPFLATAYYALNLHSSYFGANLNLRKSLALAIDRRALEATILPFGQKPAYGFVPNGTWNYDAQNWEWQTFDDEKRIAEAKRLYSLAGFSDRNPLRLRVLINSNSSIKQVAIAIASMWKQVLGIDTVLIDEEYRVFLESRKDTSKWDVARLGWTADYNDASNFLDTLRSHSPNNDSQYDRPAYDQLLDLAANSTDPANRRKILEEAETMMLSDYPILPIYFFSSKRLVKPYLKGLAANPLNRLYSRHLRFE